MSGRAAFLLDSMAEHAPVFNPKVVLAPHVARVTQPPTAARATIDNIRPFEVGRPMTGPVDRSRDS